MRSILVLLLVFTSLWTPVFAQNNVTFSLCEEVEIMVTHPAEYVQEKVKRGGLSALFMPQCFIPTWVFSPECYVLQSVLKRNSWTEIKNTYSCANHSATPQEAFSKWLGNLTSPASAIGFSLLTGGLDQVFKAYLTAAAAVAGPLPSNVRTELGNLVRASAVPFTQLEIDNAEYLAADHTLAKPIFPGGSKDAIAYHNLIIVRPGPFLQTPSAATRCHWLALWAHEMTHVHQYNQFGFDNFVTRYLEEGSHGYENITFEAEAYALQDKVERECQAARYSVFAGRRFFPVLPVNTALQLNTDVAAAIKAKEVTLNTDGSIRTMTPAARARLESQFDRAVIKDLIPGVIRQPDLVVADLTFDRVTSVFRLRVSNIGNANAGPFVIAVTGQAWGGLGTNRGTGTVSVARLGAGASTSLNLSMNQMQGSAILMRLGARLDRMSAFVDSGYSVAESSEDNNLLERRVK
jgi:hypothetical protein